MLFDTDVLIWYFKGNQKAADIFNATTHVAISAVTVMELLQSSRDKKELQLINKWLRSNAIHIHHINEEISLHAIGLLESYTLSHGIQWGDALIATTALYYGKTVLTGNLKHYQFLPSLDIRKFSPT